MGAISEFRIGPQKGPQSSLLSCPANEVFYGGARGGGKSFGILLDWYKHQSKYGDKARGILFRRTMPELEDILEKARSIYPLFGAEYKEQKRTWHFPGGASLKFRYLDRDSDADNYQGHEYNWQGFDESGNWPHPEPIDKLRACFRSAHGVKHRMILTGNPGGPGHNWLKARFIDPVPPKTIQRLKDLGDIWYRTFIPAKVQDNKILLANDPGYMARLKQAGPDWLVKAWLEGDWNIVAGGMFDDVWRNEIHIIHPFRVPQSWRIDRSFDWGSSRPFSVGWWAESDGTEVKLSDGSRKAWPRGTLFRIAEWYGWSGKPNEGCRMLATEIARGILEREKSMGIKVRPGPADSSIFDVQNGNCIADDMARIGVRWERADKSPGSRVNGWEHMRQMLKAATVHPMEEPGLFVFETCRQFIRTIPALPRDDKKPDDVNCFVAGTMVDTDKGLMPIEQIKFSDWVNTPLGLRQVTKSGVSGISKTVTVFLSNGERLIGTPNHKVFVSGKGLIPLGMLKCGQTLIERNSKSWLKRLFTKMLNTADILAEDTMNLAAILFQPVARICIGKYGLMHLGQYQKDSTFTTRMPIPTIIQLRTWSSLAEATMQDSTLNNDTLVETLCKFWIDGGLPMKGKRPFGRMLGRCTRELPNENLRALIAVSLLEQSIRSKNIAPDHARKHITSEKGKKSAQSAEARSFTRATLKKRCAPVVISVVGNCEEEVVYNLTVRQSHLYYANGVLVSNTDSEDHVADESRYKIMMPYRTATQTRIKGLY